MKIRAKTFKKWVQFNFNKSQLQDIANHGADGGWYGLTYTTDIVKLYAKYKEEIWEHLCDESESFGHHNPFEMIALFDGAKRVNNASSMETLMAWYMTESVAHQITECLD